MPYNYISLIKKKPPDSYKNLSIRPLIQNKKKAIAEISDIGRLYNPNYHPEYQKAYKLNNSAFRRKPGCFTHLVDDAQRKGSLSKPFQRYKFF